MIVAVNGPPALGLFSVAPNAGKELLDQFTMAALKWVDPALPLQYEFGFYSGTAANPASNVVQPLSLASFTKTSLPAGAASDGNRLACYMAVYDVYLGSTEMNETVTVTANTLGSSQLSSKVAEAVSGAGASPASAAQMLSVVGAMANRVNCTAAPVAVCTALHRTSCAATANTCGPCAAGYLGDWRQQLAVRRTAHAQTHCGTYRQAHHHEEPHQRQQAAACFLEPRSAPCGNWCRGCTVGR